MLDEQSGERHGGGQGRRVETKGMFGLGGDNKMNIWHGGIGGASRFFYVVKASKAEREAGLEGITAKQISTKGNGLSRTCEICGANTLNGCECENRTYSNPSRLNHHATVKPITLMRYLVRLVTPKGSVVLDPFMGSGTTGCAAMLEGMQFIGIELNQEYVEIAEPRIAYWANQNPMEL